jgi:hypothetical protein
MKCIAGKESSLNYLLCTLFFTQKMEFIVFNMHRFRIGAYIEVCNE